MPLSSVELTYWRAFDELQPIGDVRNEVHAAMIAATIRNSAGRVLPTGVNDIIRDYMIFTVDDDERQRKESAHLKSQLLRAGAKIAKQPKRKRKK